MGVPDASHIPICGLEYDIGLNKYFRYVCWTLTKNTKSITSNAVSRGTLVNTEVHMVSYIWSGICPLHVKHDYMHGCSRCQSYAHMWSGIGYWSQQVFQL